MKKPHHREPTNREALEWALNGGVTRMIQMRPHLIRPPLYQLSEKDMNTIIVVKNLKRAQERKGRKNTSAHWRPS